jgi:amino acid adenylation domain-containing protein
MSARAATLLHDFLARSALSDPEQTAVVEPGEGSITYGELAALAGRVRDRLHALGVKPGDRVGIYMRKSIDTVASICGALEAGAVYVPVDPSAPSQRNAYIMHNCSVRVAIVERRFEQQFRRELQQLGWAPELFLVDRAPAGAGVRHALDAADMRKAAPRTSSATPASNVLAYILYTSGSTGKPKGVSLSHENAVTFVDWCSEVFEPSSSDRFSSHAPFHFDLSILDIYVALKHRATLVLIPDDLAKDPPRLAPLIAEQRITCWYSAPSILSLLAQYGNLSAHDYSALRLVLFAGEVFPVKHLRSLTQLLPAPRYFNLYGPTETNVCTYYEVLLPVPDDRTAPYPIGKVCSHLSGMVVDENGRKVTSGEEGELCIAGSGVMHGYWAMPEQTPHAFLVDDAGQRWYRTGDIVAQGPDGNYTYRGRRDRMVKRRGYRVELGEIEAGLYRHAQIKEAAVVARPDEEAGVRIKAFLSCRAERRPSLIELKRFCSENLPLYMIPDEFAWCEALPKTSTDKIDYQRLKAMN